MEKFQFSPFIPPKRNTKKFMNTLLGQHSIHDMEELHELAGAVAQEISAGDILLLDGDLGSGKTTFVRTLGTQMGAENIVTSPTFTVAAEYDVPHNHVINQIVHLDLYRIQGEMSKEDQAYIQELFDTAKHLRRVIVVEWAERLGSHIPEHHWQLTFQHGKQSNERIIIVSRG